MPGKEFEIWDVFTDTALAGNQLGVVQDASGLSGELMQAIARELNLSETIFFSQPENPAHAARARIFMPKGELPFAGHPTIGGSIALAAKRGLESGELVIEEGVGPVRCTVSAGNGRGVASFVVPKVPSRDGFAGTIDAVAAASGVERDAIGFVGHELSIWSAGIPFLMVPVKSKDVLARLTIDASQFTRLDVHREGKIAAGYYYARTGANAFQVRMFAPWDGIEEDPATGSAAAAFAGALAAFEHLPDGNHEFSIAQGIEMGRPSAIGLTISLERGAIRQSRISGKAVKVAEGRLILPG